MGVVQRPVTAAESRRGADGLVVLPPEVPLPAFMKGEKARVREQAKTALRFS